jgi:branched-chain amino acid transport system substrate-binding protein
MNNPRKCEKEYKMKRFANLKCVFVLLVVVFVILFTTFIGCAKKSEPKEIKIGAILPLTGDGAAYGQKEKNGIELAVQQANESGCINGKKVKVVYEDSQGIPAPAVSAAQKLINIEKVSVIIGDAFSSPTLAMVPVAHQNKVVIMSPSASSPKLSGASPFFFRVWPSDTSEGTKMAEVAIQELKLNKFSVIYGNNDYAVGLKDVFIAKIKEMGKEIVAVEVYNEGDSDFRTQLARIKEKSPDAIYMPGYYKEFVKILTQAKEMGIKAQFLSCGTFHEPEILKAPGNIAEGVVFVQPYFDRNSNDPVTKAFVAAYEKRFNLEAGVYDAHGYDAARVILDVMKQGKISAEDVRKGLLALKDFPGVTGKTTFIEGGDVIKPARVMIVKEGRFVDFSVAETK